MKANMARIGIERDPRNLLNYEWYVMVLSDTAKKNRSNNRHIPLIYAVVPLPQEKVNAWGT